MAVNYVTVVKTNRLQVMSDAVSAKTFVVGSGAGSAGKLVIGTSGLSGATGVLVTITLQNPAFTLSGVDATFAGLPLSGTATGAGTAALAEVRTSADVVIISGLTVGVGSGDIQLGTTTIAVSNTVTINTGSKISHA